MRAARCPKCKNLTAEGDAFCDTCGAPVGTRDKAGAPASDSRSRNWIKVGAILLSVALLVGGVATAWWFWPRLNVNSRLLRLLHRSKSLPVVRPLGPIVQIPPAVGSESAQFPESIPTRTDRPNLPTVIPSGGAATTAADVSQTKSLLSQLGDSRASVPEAASKNQEDFTRKVIPLDNARKASPDDPSELYRQARELYQQGKVEDAVNQAKSVLTKQPNLDEAHLLISAAAVQQQDYKAAEQELQSVKNQTQIFTLLILGAIQLGQAKLKEATATFEKAAQVAPNNAAAQYDLGLAHQQGNNLSQAQKYYQSAISEDPQLGEAHYNLGTVLMQTDGPEAAFKEFHAAALAKPGDSTIAAALSSVTQASNSDSDAIVGGWLQKGGNMKISGQVNGEPMSQTVQMPAGGQISITKTGAGYQLTEEVAGLKASTIVQKQADGSYQAPTVVPPELSKFLPPGISDTGTVIFWASGDTLFGDTNDTVEGPNTHLSIVRSWQAGRIKGGTNASPTPAGSTRF